MEIECHIKINDDEKKLSMLLEVLSRHLQGDIKGRCSIACSSPLSFTIKCKDISAFKIAINSIIRLLKSADDAWSITNSEKTERRR